MDPLLIAAVSTLGGLGIIFAGGLAFADKKLRVEEDPRIDLVQDALPGANCGACGKAGCRDFAESIVNGTAKLNGCSVGGNDTAQRISEILGIEAGITEKKYPVILCRGGNAEAVNKMTKYLGPMSCSAITIVSGGDKLCMYGCVGGGDCVTACPFDAMIMNENGLPEVVKELCTGCGVCAQVCPRNVIEMHPDSHKVFVLCKNHDDPKTAKEVCTVACTGCGICVRKAGDGMSMDNYLPIIDYEKLDPETIPFDKCKSSSIRRFN